MKTSDTTLQGIGKGYFGGLWSLWLFLVFGSSFQSLPLSVENEMTTERHAG
jgi:hypothetical protein